MILRHQNKTTSLIIQKTLMTLFILNIRTSIIRQNIFSLRDSNTYAYRNKESKTYIEIFH